MPFLLAFGLGLSVIGAGLRLAGARKQSRAQDANEELRKQQVGLDSARARRVAIREGISARSLALANATSQGASKGSGLQGGLAQISSSVNRTQQGIKQNEELGLGVFENNRQISRAGAIFSAGQGLSSLGGSLVQNYGTFQRIGGG